MQMSRLAGFGLAIAVVAGAGVAYVVADRPGSSSPTLLRQPAARAGLLAPLPHTPELDPAAVARQLRAATRDPAFGGSLEGLVVDAETGRRLFARDPTSPLPPASTAKLLTATAALESLGPRATLSTGVVRAGNTLFLVGGGDVTLTRRPQAGYPQPATLADLAAHTAAALGGAGPVHVSVDAGAWSGPTSAPGWSPTYFTEGDVSHLSALEVDEAWLRPRAHRRDPAPDLQAGGAFVAALRKDGVRVSGPVDRGEAPPSGFGVASVSSPPLAALVHRMLTDSDNDLAEALGRAVAAHGGAPRDFAGEATVIEKRLRALGLPMDGVTLYDASGLSRLDRVTPAALVAVLQLAAEPGRPELRPVLDGLPVAGLTGTLYDRFRRGPARAGAGDVRAKTGNLIGVNSLAGVLVDRDGRLLFFAFLSDRAVSPDATEAALDRLAARLRGCGCT